MILDGVAAKQLADQWATASVTDRGVALQLVSANETVNSALAGMFNATFVGLPLSRSAWPWSRPGSTHAGHGET